MHSRKQDEVLLEKVHKLLKQIAQLLFQVEPQQPRHLKEHKEVAQQPQKVKKQPKNIDRLYYQAKLRQIRKSPTPQPRKQLKPSKKSEALLKNRPNMTIVQKTHLFMLRQQQRQLMHKLKEEEIAQKKKKEQEQQLQVAQARHESTKKLNKAEYLQKMQDYNVQRALKANQLALKQLKDKVNNNTFKPKISSTSQALIAGKKYAEMDFVQRQKWYQGRSKMHHAKLERDISMRVMPFRPNLSPPMETKRSVSRSLSQTLRKSPKKTPPTTAPKKKKTEVHYEPTMQPQTDAHNVTFTRFESPTPQQHPQPPSQHIDHSDWLRSVIYKNKKDVLYFMRSLLQHQQIEKTIDILSP